jgi:hypothetical protein
VRSVRRGENGAELCESLRDDTEVRPPAALFAGEETGVDEGGEVVAHRRLGAAERLDEVAGAGVKVVLVEPGGFKTGIWEDAERDVAARERAGTEYGAAYRRMLQAVRLGTPVMGNPSSVAKVIAGAVDARSPRARYLVGLDAQVLNLVDTVTPTTIKDRVTRVIMGI